MQIEEILIIKNGLGYYGIPIEDINQISRVPKLMTLPLKPAGVRGLCAISGSIVTMIDMNLLLGMKEVDYDEESTRILSLNNIHSSNAILVSEVSNTVEINQENIEYTNQENDPVIAIYKYNNKLVQVLSLDILFAKLNSVKIEAKEVNNGKSKTEPKKEEDSNRFLIFSMDREKFALNIEYLQEIILADVDFTDISGTSSEVLGLITLREELLTVIDLREYYGFNTKLSDKNRILIASYSGKRIGLLVDSIVDIKSYTARDIEYMHDSFEDKKVSGVIHDEDSLISFFDHEVLEGLFSENEAYIDSDNLIVTADESKKDAMEVIVFKLSGKEYAFEVENVAEIIDIVDSTKVAYTDEAIDGIINIRGQIVTIVSLFKKLNITTKIDEDSKIIVCQINGTKIGFIVDSVSDILDISLDEIKKQDDDIFTSILHLENGKRLVLSMDIDKILS